MKLCVDILSIVATCPIVITIIEPVITIQTRCVLRNECLQTILSPVDALISARQHDVKAVKTVFLVPGYCFIRPLYLVFSVAVRHIIRDRNH